MSNTLYARLPPELLDGFEAYCRQHKLTKSQAARVAIGRLLQKKPSIKEIEVAQVETGAAAYRGRE